MSSLRTPVLRTWPLRLVARVGCLVLFSAPPVGAQPASQTLPPVVVVGTREPTPLDRIVGDVVVIDRERIQSSRADSLEDLLRREGGIQLSRNGGPGQSAAILLRGSGASSTLVLVDGVRVGSATLGQADLATIGLDQIERIEILRGPGSSLYGADAVGGVVQIITRRGSGAARFAADAAVGELASSRAGASISGSNGRVDYAAGVSRESSRGVSAVKPGDAFGLFNPDRDGFRRSGLHLRAGIEVMPGHRLGMSLVENRLHARYDGAEFAPPDFVPDPSPDFRNDVVNRVASLDYRGALSRNWTMTAQAARQSDDLLSGANEKTRYRTDRDQFTWQNVWIPAEGQQFLGALERLDEKVNAAPFLFAAARHNTAAVLGYTGTFGAYKLQADARRDRNSVFGSVDTGKLGVSFDAKPGLTLRLVGGTAFRAPTFNDLYFPGFGVGSLAPERSRSIEAGLRWTGAAGSLGGTVYRNRIRELIGYEPDSSLCPPDPSYRFGCARNVGRATLQGATLEASHRSGAFSTRATIDFLDARDDVTGERLPRRAAHQESLLVDWSRGAWSAGTTLLRVGARPDFGVVLPAYTTVDLQARYRFGTRWQLETKLLNLFDRHYEPQRDYQAIGRQAWIGVRYESAGL